MREIREKWENIVWGGSLDQISFQITEWAADKGFDSPSHLTPEVLQKLMLVVTELSEAAEAVRDVDISNFKEEIADAFIRLFHIAGAMGFSIEREIIEKMVKNELRPKIHGRGTSA